MFIAFGIYCVVFKKQKNKFIHDKSSFIKVDLSTKYQHIENQRTYYIVTGLLLLFAIFTFITNIIKILFTSIFNNILKAESSNYIFFMGVFLKTAGTISYLLWKIPSLLKDVEKILKINTRREVGNQTEKNKNNGSNIVVPQATQNNYFNQYGKEW
ncbi:Hypothetical protein SRAE_2000343700 [Strongyloides ratti]|uniref:Uncharacterized protein n=1 Tax=Strongyloides ratti TaxID=34506 RepID=A0A090LGA6_STRRB|nr:Hypothetical protein SRAE_2000343700 [Strongyloides ratti]CEF68782.1 Hypothetical protein SRAE_2000343700 [Strongyloides ratti]